MKIRPIVAIAAFTLLAAASPACAEAEVRHEQVQFQAGTSGATVKGTVKGRQIVDYRLRATAGQNLDVAIKAGKGSPYFNVLTAGGDSPLFVGSISGDHFFGQLPKDGEYTIRVYLLGNAASSNQSATFTLDIDITGKPVSAARGSTPPARYDASCATSPPAAPRSGSPTAPMGAPVFYTLPAKNSPPMTGPASPPSAQTTTGVSASVAGSSI